MAPAGDQHSWHLYVVRLGDGAKVSRDVFIERLFASGIASASTTSRCTCSPTGATATT